VPSLRLRVFRIPDFQPILSIIAVHPALPFRNNAIKDGVLVLRTAKTGTEVRVPQPPAALKALAAIPTDN
jgi:hypothetical protein